IGTSSAAPQPGPLTCVSEYPVIDVSPKLYPPPAARLGMVSGLHCTIPNGTSAPGNVLPPPLVHVRVSTSVAGSLTGWVSGVVLRAPAGRFPGGTGLGQSAGLPSGPLAQGTGLPFDWAGAAVLGLEVAGGAPGLGAGDGSA